ncbi:acetyltransferase [Bacillus sp. JCM 19047]|nr:acetyltransferase [Bacillus sp. JCM 19047]
MHKNIFEIDYEENKSATNKDLMAYFKSFNHYNSSDVDIESQDKEPKLISLVYKDNGKIVGRVYGEVDLNLGSCRTDGLFVDENARGTGAGKLLMTEMERIAIEEGCTVAFVDTSSSSAPKFYEMLGYSLIGTVDEYPVKNETFYFYYKKLK